MWHLAFSNFWLYQRKIIWLFFTPELLTASCFNLEGFTKIYYILSPFEENGDSSQWQKLLKIGRAWLWTSPGKWVFRLKRFFFSFAQPGLYDFIFVYELSCWVPSRLLPSELQMCFRTGIRVYNRIYFNITSLGSLPTPRFRVSSRSARYLSLPVATLTF